jgi:hypothetical protein
MLVGNVVTSGHQDRIVSPTLPLKHERKIPKAINLIIKGIEWDMKQWHP